MSILYATPVLRIKELTETLIPAAENNLYYSSTEQEASIRILPQIIRTPYQHPSYVHGAIKVDTAVYLVVYADRLTSDTAYNQTE